MLVAVRKRRRAKTKEHLMMRPFTQEAAALPIDLPVPVPLGQVLPWLAFATLLYLLAIYFVGAEQGATSLLKGMYVHEFVHDGRHLLGFPCH